MSAIYISNSGNTKIMGSKPVDASYAAVKNTCPDTCALKDSACYAQLSFVGMHMRKLEKQNPKASALEVARVEAKAIDSSYNGGIVPKDRFLRLHVSGDSRTIKGSNLINSAVNRWKKRGGGKVWSYTHAWRNVPRTAWKAVSMLASVDSISEVKAARKQGYAPAIVVDYHRSEKAYKLDGSNVKWIPCPAQTNPGGKQIGCSDCQLCFDSNRLFKNNFGIAFAAHGIRKDSIKKRLQVIK